MQPDSSNASSDAARSFRSFPALFWLLPSGSPLSSTSVSYTHLPFTVTSAGTAGKNEDGGYEIFAYGFPEGTRFYRADAGEELVTGPHVTGTEEVIVKDEAGRIVWKRAESDSSDLLYQPERDAVSYTHLTEAERAR